MESWLLCNTWNHWKRGGINSFFFVVSLILMYLFFSDKGELKAAYIGTKGPVCAICHSLMVRNGTAAGPRVIFTNGRGSISRYYTCERPIAICCPGVLHATFQPCGFSNSSKSSLKPTRAKLSGRLERQMPCRRNPGCLLRLPQRASARCINMPLLLLIVPLLPICGRSASFTT